MGRLREKLNSLMRRLHRAWVRYSEFIEGHERADAARFEAARMQPTWIMKSDIDANFESQLSSVEKELDFRTLSRFYPYGFEFRRVFTTLHNSFDGVKSFSFEVELTRVFSHGELFRPESRCTIDPSLFPSAFEVVANRSRDESQNRDAAAGKVFVTSELKDWLAEIGFAEFYLPDAKAVMIHLGSHRAWIVIDPRPEIFSRPLSERIAKLVSDAHAKSVKKSDRWMELEP